MSAPGQCAIRVDELGQHIQLEARVVEVINSANDLVQGLLHQVGSNAALHCQFTLVLDYELSKHDSLSFSFGLALHVCKSIFKAEGVLTRSFVDEVTRHLLLLVFQ